MTRDVRQATTDDVWAVHETARESWHAAYDGILGAERVDDVVDEWYAIDDLESSIDEAGGRDDAVFLVAGAPLREAETGMSGTGCRGFAHVVPWPEDASVGYLVRLYVHPDRWGDGTGTALLERLETETAGTFDRLRLSVLADNEVGISFYESRGFERQTTRQTDLGDGIEEHVYEKPLSR
ncbi:GNAT family N-acetyltransferase [Halopiger djelfimassiliensis]|uniref:GNAT family N-acetyltransferase n=1 Tax=Halopiger djelfimassiliensis TaxID=1293047 RepID=UPI0006780B01|nr:GNAT family N-acetyltransferase [Halopiger djelfimassiliensis]